MPRGPPASTLIPPVGLSDQRLWYADTPLVFPWGGGGGAVMPGVCAVTITQFNKVLGKLVK